MAIRPSRNHAPLDDEPHNTASRTAATVEQFTDGTTLEADGTYYYAHVLHHHLRSAANSTVYKSSKLITTTTAVFS